MWRSHVLPRWALYRRMCAAHSPLRSLPLTSATLLPWRLWDRPRWLRLIGIRVASDSEGRTVLNLGRGLALALPGAILEDESVIPASYPSFVFQALQHFVAVALCDQYGVCGTLKPGQTVLDVGANVGCFALLASRLVGPEGRVVAVEPVPQNVECLRHMCALNGLSNVEVVAAAIGDHEGDLELTLATDMMGHSARHKKSAETIQVRLTTIDTLVSELGCAKVHQIKIDIEGMEAEALAGARATISSQKPRLSMSGYHYDDDQARLPEMILALREDYQVGVHQFAPELEKVVIAE